MWYMHVQHHGTETGRKATGQAFEASVLCANDFFFIGVLVVQWLAHVPFTSVTQVRFPFQCSYQIKIPPWSHVERVFPV